MRRLKDLHAKYITNEAGEKTSVIMPAEEFEELLDDVKDLAATAERRGEPTIPHEEVVKGLKKNGLI